MKHTFGELFNTPLFNTKVSIYNLNIDINVDQKILLISDCHIQDIPLFKAELKNLINKEQPTILLVLGDLVNGSWPKGPAVLQDLMFEFQNYSIPTYIIGGNHDRAYVDVNQSIQGVTLIKDTAILLKIHQQQANLLKIYFAHDLLNNFRVRDKHAFSFFDWIKSGAEKINSEDWLICGHAHTSLLSNSIRCACIGQYSPENNIRCYSILEIINKNAKLSEKVMIT